MTDLLIQILPYFVAVIAPLLVAAQLNRNRRAEKQQDWDRQDEVAAKAEDVAKKAAAAADLLVAAQAATGAKLDAIKDVADVTHTLVNSNYTAALEDRLAGLNREVILLEAVGPRDNDPEGKTTAEAIEVANTRIVDLEKLLRERAEQQKQADEAASKATAAPAVALVEAADELKDAADELKDAKPIEPEA